MSMMQVEYRHQGFVKAIFVGEMKDQSSLNIDNCLVAKPMDTYQPYL